MDGDPSLVHCNIGMAAQGVKQFLLRRTKIFYVAGSKGFVNGPFTALGDDSFRCETRSGLADPVARHGVCSPSKQVRPRGGGRLFGDLGEKKR